MAYILDILNNLQSIVRTMSLVDYLDIIFLACLVFFVLKFVRETRADQLLKGIIILIIIFFLLQQLHFKALGELSRAFINVGAMAVVVMFQPELRRALEKVGRAKVVSGSGFVPDTVSSETASAIVFCLKQIVTACERLSRTATGALIVIERQTKLGEILDGATIINAFPSDELICNIFFHNAPLHDGAVIIRGGKIYAAGCYLPKPQKDELISKELGTRHRAAIGVSEVSDSIVVVVSEETGIISVVENGNITRGFDKEKLLNFLTENLVPKKPDHNTTKAGKKRKRKKSAGGKR